MSTLAHDQPLPPRVPQADFSFSDHEGVRALLSVRRGPPADARESKDASLRRTDALLDAAAVCAQGLRTVGKARRGYALAGALVCLAQAGLVGVLVLAEVGAPATLFLALATLALAAGLAFCVYMAAVFSSQERSAVLATKAGLDRLLAQVRERNAKFFEEDRKRAAKQ